MSATAAYEAVPLEPVLAKYCMDHSSPITSASLLTAISERTTKSLPDQCHMVSDSLVGLLMRSLIHSATISSSSHRILEIGAFTGYSAGWMLDSLPSPSGLVVSLELSEEYAAIVRDNLSAHPNYGQLKLMVGPALESLGTFAAPQGSATENPAAFDFIFIDADKPAYASYVDFIFKQNLLKPTGILMLDNMLWKGRVTHSDPDDTTRSIQQLGRTLADDSRFLVTMVPIRDGVTIVQHKKPTAAAAAK